MGPYDELEFEICIFDISKHVIPVMKSSGHGGKSSPHIIQNRC